MDMNPGAELRKRVRHVSDGARSVTGSNPSNVWAVSRYSSSRAIEALGFRAFLRPMTATQAPWFSALAPYVERDDLVVELANPFLTPTGERVDSRAERLHAIPDVARRAVRG